MAYGHLKPITVGQFYLQALLEGSTAVTIASSRVSQNEHLILVGVAVAAFFLIPTANTIGGKFWGVRGDAHINRTSIGSNIVDSVGGGDTLGLGAKVMVSYRDRCL